MSKQHKGSIYCIEILVEFVWGREKKVLCRDYPFMDFEINMFIQNIVSRKNEVPEQVVVNKYIRPLTINVIEE